jgi:serine O-acetyltransferase
MRLIDELQSDLRAKQALYSQYGDHHSMLRIVLADGTIANILYRLQSAFVRWKLLPFALLVHYANKWMNGCVIGVKAQFGPGLVLIHPIGVVVNSSVCAGKNIFIESSVVIGDNRGKIPVLGDDIFIGSGAKIIGGVHLGTGARVGANAVVLHSVAAGSTVVGIPARPVSVRKTDKDHGSP